LGKISRDCQVFLKISSRKLEPVSDFESEEEKERLEEVVPMMKKFTMKKKNNKFAKSEIIIK